MKRLEKKKVCRRCGYTTYDMKVGKCPKCGLPLTEVVVVEKL